MSFIVLVLYPYIGLQIITWLLINRCWLDTWINEQTTVYTSICYYVMQESRVTKEPHEFPVRRRRSLWVTPFGSPAPAICSVWFCFLQQGMCITTQHESDFTYGKVTWDLDPTARSEKEVNEWYYQLIVKPVL